jgi:hypothetical protein
MRATPKPVGRGGVALAFAPALAQPTSATTAKLVGRARQRERHAGANGVARVGIMVDAVASRGSNARQSIVAGNMQGRRFAHRIWDVQCGERSGRR